MREIPSEENAVALVDIIMPQMGESIVEGTLSKWLKKLGDEVKRDEPLFEISTDKVDAEIPAPAAGVLAEILVQEGETVEVQTVVARLETEKGATVGAAAKSTGPAAAESETPAAASGAPPPENRICASVGAIAEPFRPPSRRFYARSKWKLLRGAGPYPLVPAGPQDRR